MCGLLSVDATTALRTRRRAEHRAHEPRARGSPSCGMRSASAVPHPRIPASPHPRIRSSAASTSTSRDTRSGAMKVASIVGRAPNEWPTKVTRFNAERIERDEDASRLCGVAVVGRRWPRGEAERRHVERDGAIARAGERVHRAAPDLAPRTGAVDEDDGWAVESAPPPARTARRRRPGRTAPCSAPPRRRE